MVAHSCPLRLWARCLVVHSAAGQRVQFIVHLFGTPDHGNADLHHAFAGHSQFNIEYTEHDADYAQDGQFQALFGA